MVVTTRLNFSAATIARFGRAPAAITIQLLGTHYDLTLDSLDLHPGSTEGQIKHAVAVSLMVEAEQLEDLVVDRHSNGNLTLRPEAMFG